MKRIYWVLILLLTALVVWQVMDLKVTYRKIAFIKARGVSSSNVALTSVQKSVAKQKEYLGYVERNAIWKPGTDPLSWLTGQAGELGLKVVGVERLPTSRISEYEQVPLSITVKGDYNLLGMLINRLERFSFRSQRRLGVTEEQNTNTFKIDSLRMGRKESSPDQTIMTLSLSYYRKVGKS